MKWKTRTSRQGRSSILILGICIVTGLCVFCSKGMRKLEKETILKRMATLTAFTGTYSETGVAKTPQDTRISARVNPVAATAKTVSKGAAEGSVLHYAGSTLATHFPKSGFGIRYRNVPELSLSDQVRWLELEYDWHVDHYDISQLEDAQVAGYETKGILYKPNAAFAASPFSFEWQAFVEPNYAFALRTIMRKNGNEKYRLEFREITFQKTAENDLTFRFPPGTTVAEYDLAGKNFSLTAANAAANFKIVLPKSSAEFPLKKIIRVQGIIPAFTAYFENLPYQTYYTQVKDYGLNLIPPRGLLLEAKRKYRVNFAGAFKSVYFLEKGVYHTIVSSKPLSEVLGWLEEN